MCRVYNNEVRIGRRHYNKVSIQYGYGGGCRYDWRGFFVSRVYYNEVSIQFRCGGVSRTYPSLHHSLAATLALGGVLTVTFFRDTCPGASVITILSLTCIGGLFLFPC